MPTAKHEAQLARKMYSVNYVSVFNVYNLSFPGSIQSRKQTSVLVTNIAGDIGSHNTVTSYMLLHMRRMSTLYASKVNITFIILISRQLFTQLLTSNTVWFKILFRYTTNFWFQFFLLIFPFFLLTD